jgi:hypothetical protein
MVCEKCGEKMDDGDKFCRKCGTERLHLSTESTIQRNNNSFSATASQKAKITDILRKKSEKILTDLNRHTKYSYREAMKYFVDHKADDPNITKGAMVLEQLQSGYQIYEVFLDRNNNLMEDKRGCPLGFKLKIDDMDEELSELFSKSNIVFVE